MKLTALFPFVTTVIASQVYHLHDNYARAMLMDRGIDPSTMDPALLSLLMVLKTAMPSGTNVPLPTGTSEPDWYKNLPDNIKSSLHQYYPATATSSSSSSSSSSSTSQVTSTAVSSSSQASESVTPTSTPAITSAPSFSSTSMSSAIFSNSSTATSPPLSSVSGFTSPSSNQTTTVVTPPLTSAPSSAPVSAGLKNAAHMGLLTTAVAWLSVGAGFCLLA
ncbi:hypothetical protein yc1106_04473 [Curvularia clavata]|uniref:Uncharacterized protein n=1 Tax=Curvularia clavata TaxID=95742 RepID=A0A9Q9DSX4_CURCL|nr:hypothetical protein yc1106_04473 [Curvularia clavata]